MAPHHSLATVRRLAASEERCAFFGVVLDELKAHGLDSDDLRAILETELGEAHWYKSEPTLKYYPGTISDYFSIWVNECGCYMFLKIIVDTQEDGDYLVVSSFKKDDRL